jgi:hypothetical protein
MDELAQNQVRLGARERERSRYECRRICVPSLSRHILRGRGRHISGGLPSSSESKTLRSFSNVPCKLYSRRLWMTIGSQYGRVEGQEKSPRLLKVASTKLCSGTWGKLGSAAGVSDLLRRCAGGRPKTWRTRSHRVIHDARADPEVDWSTRRGSVVVCSAASSFI